jgi:hypothetical protein
MMCYAVLQVALAQVGHHKQAQQQSLQQEQL